MRRLQLLTNALAAEARNLPYDNRVLLAQKLKENFRMNRRSWPRPRLWRRQAR